MRKELLVAIVIGLFFGIIIGFGIWRANNAISKDQVSTEATPTNKATDEEVVTKPQDEVKNDQVGFVISTPPEYGVITTSPTTIKGLTSPNGKVVVSAENKDYIVTASDNGDFEVIVDLVSGLNQILFTEADSMSHLTLKVIYSKDFEQ